jgi:Flp pilus assembly protein TadD
MQPYSYLKTAIDGIVTKAGLATCEDWALNDLSERCAVLVTPASQQVDEEVVRRGPQRMYTESYIRSLIRLGRNSEAVAALPLLAGSPHADEWQQYFKKFVDDLAFEEEMKKEAAPLIASGKNADQLHEEGLTLHKQQKQRQSLPYYQAAIMLAPQSSRFHNNYAVAVTDLKHYFLSETLCRKSILYDPNRARAYMALGRTLITSNRHLAAYLLLKESLRLGYNDSFTWSNLAIVADNLKFTKEARTAVKEARKLDPNNPDLQRFRHLEN